MDEEDKSTADITNLMDDLHVDSTANEAIKLSRLYGGAVIFIGVSDGQDLDKPLNPSRIRAWNGLRVIDRTQIEYYNIKFQSNPALPDYGKPEFYPIEFGLNGVTQTIPVHKSRIIELHGRMLPYTYKNRNYTYEMKYWGISELEMCKDQLSYIAESMGGVSTLLHEISVGKYKFKDLADILASTDGSELLATRVEQMDLFKSVFHSVYMDAEEDYTRENVTLAGVSDVLYQYFMQLSAVTGYPMTRLFGVSPAGLNSTGEGDMLNYYDMVRNRQVTVLKPVVQRLLDIVCEWKGFEVPQIEFKPLKQMTEKEEAELELSKNQALDTKVNAYQKLIDMGIMAPYMVEYLEYGESLKKIPLPEGFDPEIDDPRYQMKEGKEKAQQLFDDPDNEPDNDNPEKEG